MFTFPSSLLPFSLQNMTQESFIQHTTRLYYLYEKTVTEYDKSEDNTKKEIIDMTKKSENNILSSQDINKKEIIDINRENLQYCLDQIINHIKLSSLDNKMDDIHKSMINLMSDLKSELTSKSYSKGKVGEFLIFELIKERFSHNHIERITLHGDIVFDDNILIEVKNYTHSVGKKETDKFEKDMLDPKYICGIMISNTGINNKLDMEINKVNQKYIMYVSKATTDIIINSIDFILEIKKFSIEMNKDINNAKILKDSILNNDILSKYDKLRTNIDKIIKNYTEQNNIIGSNLSNMEFNVINIRNIIKSNFDFMLNLIKDQNKELD